MAKRTSKSKSPVVPALNTQEMAALDAEFEALTPGEKLAVALEAEMIPSAETSQQAGEQYPITDEEFAETTDLVSGEPMPATKEEQAKPEFSSGIQNLLRRLRLKAQDELWASVRVNQEGDRFSVAFPPDFYNANRQACYSFSGRLAKVSRMRGARSATFDRKGFLVILVSSPQDTSVI